MHRVLFALSAVIVLAAAGVVDLDESNFDSVIDGSKAAFVEFFAPWCGHCKKLAPDYEVVGETFNNQPVVVAKVDCDANSGVCQRYGVQGYPTLKFFPKGAKDPIPYEGGRSIDELVTFINNKVGLNARVKKAPSAVVDLDSSNFDSIALNTDKDVLVEFYAPWCGHCKNLIPTYEKLAKVYAADDNIVIAKVDADTHRDLGTRYGVSGFPTLKWFGKQNKDAPLPYEQGRELNEFVSYINRMTGSKRDPSGRLSGEAGRVSALDTLAAGFAAATDKDSIVAKANELISSLTGDDAKSGTIYGKMFKAIAEKGADFVNTELARLERMMNDVSVTAKKLDEFTVRQNILKAFNA